LLYIYIKKPEIWRYVTYTTIKPKTYLISNHGRVYSTITKKILKPAIKTHVHDNGHIRNYLMVTLVKSKNINKERKYVDINIHRLVAHEFVINSNPEILNFVHHCDNNPLNNYYENLEWVDNYCNQIHAKYDGLLRKTYEIDIIELVCKMIYEENRTNKYITKYLLKTFKKYNFNSKNISSLLSHLRHGDRHTDIVNKYKNKVQRLSQR